MMVRRFPGAPLAGVKRPCAIGCGKKKPALALEGRSAAHCALWRVRGSHSFSSVEGATVSGLALRPGGGQPVRRGPPFMAPQGF